MRRAASSSWSGTYCFLYSVAIPNSVAPSTLWALPTDGGMPQRIVADERLTNVRVDASYVYFQASSPSGAGRIARLPKASRDASTAEVIADTVHPGERFFNDLSPAA